MQLSLALGSLAEWATAVVALVAVILSAIAIGLTRAALRNSDLLHVHDRLMSVDVQAGRRLLQEVYEKGQPWAELYRDRPEDFDKINHAVGMDEMMAQGAHLGVASKERLLGIWGTRLAAAWPALESFIRYRRELSRRPELWHELVWFAKQAEAVVTISTVDLPRAGARP